MKKCACTECGCQKPVQKSKVVWEERSDVERTTDFEQGLYAMCTQLDDQKQVMVAAINPWMHTTHASALIQAMARVDEAIRILEKEIGKR